MKKLLYKSSQRKGKNSKIVKSKLIDMNYYVPVFKIMLGLRYCQPAVNQNIYFNSYGT